MREETTVRFCYLVGMGSSVRDAMMQAWVRIGHALALSAALTACAGDDSADASTNVAGPCVSDADCSETTCGADEVAYEVNDLEPVELTCGEWNEGGLAGTRCTERSDCARSLCVVAGTCVVPCGHDADCEEDQRCQPVFVRGRDDFLHAVGGCVERVSLPEDAAVSSELRLDALAIGDSTVELPGATVPTLFALEHEGEEPWAGEVCRPPICVHELRSLLDGSVLFSRVDIEAGGAPPLNPVDRTPTAQPVVVYLGNGPATPLSDLGYEVDLTTETTGDLRVTRIARAVTGGLLDLNVYYVGAMGWEPEGVRGNPILSGAIDHVDTIFAPADISIGDVRQIAIGGALPARGVYHDNPDNPNRGFAMLSHFGATWLEFPDLQRLSAGADNVAANVFFVRDIEDVQALSGGIPGALGMHGTGSSGIVIETSGMGGAVELGRKLAHELGHHLGLFHTKELSGEVWSPITDIPDDSDNLMNPAPDLDGTVLSAQQRAILAQAPILQ